MNRGQHVVFVAVICAAAACGGTTSQKASSTSPPIASPASNPGQRATICTADDASGSPDESVPLPTYRRLGRPITTWFGRVQLDPPQTTATPKVSLSEVWGSEGFWGERYPSAIFDVVLAEWTSDDLIVMKPNGQPVPHRHVLAWVAMGKHRPVDAIDVSPSLTVPGVACYFGKSITAVNAMTGQPIADAWDYH